MEVKVCFRKHQSWSFRKLCNSVDSYHSLNYVLRIVRLIHWVPVCTSTQTRYGEASSLDRDSLSRLSSVLIKVHALRQRSTYTHASSYRSFHRSWGSSGAGGGGRGGGVVQCGPWAASPWRSSLRSGRSSWSCGNAAGSEGEEAGKRPCLAPSSKFGAPLWRSNTAWKVKISLWPRQKIK